MYKFPVQFDRYAGPNAIGENKLTLSIDESIVMGNFNPTKIKKGTQFMLSLIEATDVPESLTDESAEEAKTRLQKMLHAKINEIATQRKMKAEEVKDRLREFLKKSGKIKESTKELDVQGYSFAIYYLQEILTN